MWRPAIKELSGVDKIIYGPKSFKRYCLSNDLGKRSTAASISIDYLEKLSRDLRDENIMVLRAGESDHGKETQFVLVKSEKVEDFFLQDEAVFDGNPVQYFPPNDIMDQLELFHKMPLISETGLVNYAILSGVVHTGLGLDRGSTCILPVTGKTLYSFSFRPTISHPAVFHDRGQVEIDSMFYGFRDGKRVIVLMEAKRGDKFRSLAKHKLVYPYLGLMSTGKIECDVLPVYLKIIEEPDRIVFKIAECVISNDSILEMDVVKSSSYWIDTSGMY